MFWAVSESDKGMRVGAERHVRLLIRERYGAWHWLPVVAVYVLATLLTDAQKGIDVRNEGILHSCLDQAGK